MNDSVPVIDSRAGFAAALHWGLQTAIGQGARRIVCVDPDFADWPLEDEALLRPLSAWARRPQRRLELLARGYDLLATRRPRFAAWRRVWAHAVDARQVPPELTRELPTLLLSDGAVCVQLIDPVHGRGRAALDQRLARVWLEQIDALLQRSDAGFAVNTLGL